MSSCWYGLRGKVLRQSGTTSGTPAVPAGAALLRVLVYAASTAGSVVLPDGVTITIPASSGWLSLKWDHTLVQLPAPATITITNVASWMIEYSLEGGA